MKYLPILFVILLSACAPVRTYSQLHPPMESVYTADVGSTVFKVKRSQDLPNAFGRADLWGGKIDRGFYELLYAGMTQDGLLVFEINDVQTRSNETTMSRYGSRSSVVNMRSTLSPDGNSVRTTGLVTQLGPSGSTDYVTPGVNQFVFDATKSKELRIHGLRVNILDAQPHTLEYILKK